MAGYILAIDQGTSNSKVLLIDKKGAVAATAAVPVPVVYPRPGWVEQAPNDLWSTVTAAVRSAVGDLGGAPRIAAIGISNQRESVLLWNRKTGEAIGPCITWQCRRSTERIERLRTSTTAAMVAAKTGLGLDPLFPAAKIGWLLDEYPAARRLAEIGDLCAGTVDSWLIFNLTGGAVHATDFSNASRTQLFNIYNGRWDDDLCALFGVPRSILPTVLGSDALFGLTSGAGGIPAGIPIHAALGDSHAALFGHSVRAPGEVKATFGTGSSLMSLTDRPRVSSTGLSTTIAWRRGDQTTYALEGNISVSAQAAAWMLEFLGLPDVEALTALAEKSSDPAVVVVPAFAGLGAPHWKPQARGMIAGLSLASTRADVARATLDAIALQVCDVFEAMEADLGHRLDRLVVDGGPTRNEVLMQLQADLLDRPVRRHQLAELSAAGAGVMAGVASGFWTEDEGLAILSSSDRTFEPAMSNAERAATRARWTAAVQSVR